MSAFFPHYPTPVEELVGIAAQMIRQADDLDITVGDVQRGADRAAGSTQGDLTFPMERAPGPVIRSGRNLAGQARFVAAVMLYWAEEVQFYNSRIDQVNEIATSVNLSWADFVALGSFYFALTTKVARLKEELDDAAHDAARMLAHPLKGRDFRTLREGGWYPPPDEQAAIDALDSMPPDGDPDAMRRAWDSLPLSLQARIMADRPERLGNIDGLPAEIRDEANRLVMADDLERLEQKEHDGTLTEEEERALATIRSTMDHIRDREAHTDPLTGENLRVQLYVYEPYAFDGNGRIAISNGNLDDADHQAVMVNGFNGTIQASGPGHSLNVYDESRWASSDSVAVLDWFGYDPPTNVDVANLDKAEAGAQLLASDVDGLRASRSDNPAHLTVIGDSYGSTTAGIAAELEPELALDADDLILTGSPGVPVEDTGQLTTGHDHTWVGSASRDIISVLGRTGWMDPSDIPAGLLPGVEILGNDPAEDTFGANRFQAEHTDRGDLRNFDDHRRYYDQNTESLYNIAAITTGQYGDVRTAEHRYDPLADVDVDAGIESGPFGIPIPDLDVDVDLTMQDPESDREPERVTHNLNP